MKDAVIYCKIKHVCWDVSRSDMRIWCLPPSGMTLASVWREREISIPERSETSAVQRRDSRTEN